MFLKDYFNKINAPQGGERSQQQASASVPHIGQYVNQVFLGDCIQVMKHFPSQSIGAVVTDPPYLVNYQSRDGRNYRNDDPNRPWWVAPAFAEMYRVMKDNSFCVSFYGWTQVEHFMTAWKQVGFRPVGHIAFAKDYASFEGVLKAHHEQAYVLAKGKPFTQHRIPDVLPNYYTGNKLHPSEKSPETLKPLIEAFSKPDDIVLDAFCGSGSTLVAARLANRKFIGIELDAQHAQTAADRVYQHRQQPYHERL
jgi:DNA modification methylase